MLELLELGSEGSQMAAPTSAGLGNTHTLWFISLLQNDKHRGFAILPLPVIHIFSKGGSFDGIIGLFFPTLP